MLYPQGNTVVHKDKGAGKYSPQDIQAQAEEGALHRPKSSGEDFGVMSARAGSWTDLAHPDRCPHTLALFWHYIHGACVQLHMMLALMFELSSDHSLWWCCAAACMTHCCKLSPCLAINDL